MHRSSAGPRRRLRNLRRSARGTPRAAGTAAPLVLTAVPDRNRRAADGVLIQASVAARLLGAKLLTLDATVVLVPADVTAPQSAEHRPWGRASARASGRLPAGPGAPSRGLAEAVRNIKQGDAALAETRRNGP
jgi:hypothetical protein